MLIDVLEVSPKAQGVDRHIPEFVVLDAAGIPFEIHIRIGSVEEALATHLAQYDDAMVAVVERADLEESGLPLARGALSSTARVQGLPVIFIVAEDGLLRWAPEAPPDD
jgi:hypothetical protein